MAPPIVSAEASFLTKLFIALILALEKLKEMVTASGRPSGIATTIMVIAIMMVFKRSVQSLFFKVKANESFVQPGISSHLNKLPHPHGTAPPISRPVLKIMAAKVRRAHPIPMFPILSAMVSSLL